MYSNIVIFLLLCLFPFSSAPIETNLLDQILENHASAMGGIAQWESIQTLTINLDTGDGGLMEAFTKKPDKFKLVMHFSGYEWIKGWNGKEGWALYNGEPRNLPIGEAEEMAEEPYFFDELMFAQKMGYEVQLLSKEKLRYKPVYKIQVTKPGDDKVVYYLNAANYRIEQIDERSSDPKWVNSSFSTIFEDYFEVEGRFFPRRWGIVIDQAKPRWMSIENIWINQAIPDSAFDPRQ